MHELPRPLALCCHDAGAANLVAAWCDGVDGLRLCAEGPARAIFARECPDLVPMSLDEALSGAACVLSGTGWASTLEHEARVRAGERGLPSFAVIDHWVNYAMRFERAGREVLPDAFVVTDAAAAELARGTFGNRRPVLTWSNEYLAREVVKVRRAEAAPPRRPARHVLVVLEPVREDWQPGTPRAAEFRALDHLVTHLDALAPADGRRVRLRPHPSEAAHKYREWIGGQSVAVELSTAGSLAEDLAWADLVAGLNSYALVVAHAAGRRALSYLPPGAPPCTLRVPGIETLPVAA